MNDNVQNGEVIIDINDLSKAFGDLKVLTNISTQIRKGDVVCVIGPSGSGKSTFLRCMNLLETPTGGHIYFEGTDITDPKTNIDKLRQKMGMVFQQFNLFPHMDIMKNLTLAPMKLQGKSQQEAEAEAMRLLERVGLADRAHAYPSQLSGGQKQRVAIARAVVNEPKILLADEPTGNLDRKNGEEIIDLLKLSNRNLEQTILLITHDEKIALEADRVITIEDGKIVGDQKRR